MAKGEGVSEILEKLKLTSKEEEVIEIPDEGRINEIKSCVLSLVGKFLKCKPYNKRAALSTLRRVWGLDSELQIVEVDASLFQFKFKTKFRLARILKDGPWSFDNQMLLLKRWQRGMSTANVILDHASLWVQIWGAPFDMVSPRVTVEIDGRIGAVEEVEKRRSNDSLSLFMRVRVSVFVSKPLRRGCFVSNFNGNRTWSSFKYERLGMFCYFCGFVGHDLKHCAGFFAVEKNGTTTEL